MTDTDRHLFAEHVRDEHEREPDQRRRALPPRTPAAVATPATGAVRGAHDVMAVPVRPPAHTEQLPAAHPATAQGRAGQSVKGFERAASSRRREVAPAAAPSVQTQAPIGVSAPGDAREIAARRTAEVVVHGGRAPPPFAQLTVPPVRGPPSIPSPTAIATGYLRDPTSATAVPSAVERAVAERDQGAPVSAAVRREVEPVLGVDFSAVRVHQTRSTAEAAAALGARAFTLGSHIYLGRGQRPTDVRLLAHELTHTVQPGAPGVVHRDGLGIDTAARDAIAARAESVPGYTLLTLLLRYDPIRGRHVEPTAERVIRGVLGLMPYGIDIYDRLAASGLVQRAMELVSGGLTAHDLSLARFQRELDAAWSEIHLIDGPEANLAVIARHVDAVMRDVRAFASSLVEAVVGYIREAAVGLLEDLLTGPTIGPVWGVAKKVLHYDPLRSRPVVATTEEILADLLTLLGQQDKLTQLRERGVLARVASWIDNNVMRVRGLIGELSALFQQAWAAIQPANIAHLPTSLARLADDAGRLLHHVRDFADELIEQALRYVKESLLRWLSEYAHRTRGFRLVTVLIGKDPFTQERVPLTPENLIGGFISLLPNGDQTFQQLRETGVIAEASGRIARAAASLGITWRLVTTTFLGIWDSLHLDDLLHPLDAFERIVAAFGEPVSRILSFVATVVHVVIELVLRLMNFPSDVLASIIAHVTSAIAIIRQDPIRFLRNMLEALKRGILSFVDHIGSHLLRGLGSWLFRGLRSMGITPPADLSPRSVITLVLQVLGLSMDLLWTKLGERLGVQAVARIRGAIDMLSGAWNFIKDVQTRGFAAIWEYIQGQLSNLWQTILSTAQAWIQERIIAGVVQKLISMLDPTGIMAIVNSFIAFFRAVQSLIDYLRDILELINDYVTTLDAVARGNVGAGAQRVERGLAMAVPMAIGFLANQVGIGNIPEKVVEIVQGVRGLVDRAITWLIDQAVRLGQSVLARLGLGSRQGQTVGSRGDIRDVAGDRVAALLGTQEHDEDEIRAELNRILAELRPQGLTGLAMSDFDENGEAQVQAAASPPKNQGKIKKKGKGHGRRVRCRLNATLQFSSAAGPERVTAGQRFYEEPLPHARLSPGVKWDQGAEQAPVAVIAPPPSGWLPGRGRRGGSGRGLVAQQPEPGSTTLRLASWNTGDPVPETNDSHAERQFLDWFSPFNVPGLVGMELSINISPCSICAPRLSAINSPLAKSAMTLRWAEAYYGVDHHTGAPLPNVTTTDDVELLRQTWTVGGPMPTLSAADRDREQRRVAQFERV